MDRSVKPEELEKLRRANVSSIEELWRLIDEDVDQGIDQVANRTGISPARLTDLLIHELLQGVDGRNGVGIHKWWTSFKIHLLDVILIVTSLILIVLALRAGGTLAGTFSSLGMGTVIVAASDLEPGRVIDAGDLYTAPLRPRSDYFKTVDALDGLILSKRVPSQKPIRYTDVLRFQVVATADIPVGAQLDDNNIKMSWSPYRPTAFTAANQIIASKTRLAIRSGAVVTTEAVSSNE